MKTDYSLHSKDRLTFLLLNKGISTWNKLTEFIKYLPYGRNTNRNDLSLVIIDRLGTCSSKHALLKHVADLNAIPKIKLILGLYKMTPLNTPKIGNALDSTTLKYIPEAHCYLMINGERRDFTSAKSEFRHIKNDILLEKEIEPNQVINFKIDFHKNFIKTWIKDNEIPFEFDDIWKLREQCITNMSV